MALEELRRDIEHEARLAAAKLDKEGDAEAKVILDRANGSADETKKRALESAGDEAEQRKREGLITLEMELSAMLSSAKEESLKRQMRDFNALVAKRLQASEQSLIKSALKNFSGLMPLDEALIRIDKRNAELVKQYKAKVEYTQIRGVVITSLDGRVTADASVEGLLESHKDTVRRVLSKAMFG